MTIINGYSLISEGEARLQIRMIEENEWEFLLYEDPEKESWRHVMTIQYRERHNDYQITQHFPFVNERGVGRLRNLLLKENGV